MKSKLPPNAETAGAIFLINSFFVLRWRHADVFFLKARETPTREAEAVVNNSLADCQSRVGEQALRRDRILAVLFSIE